MLTVEQALERVMEEVRPMPAERVSLDRALGRVLAEEVASPLDIPGWDNSAMDGYAVRAADVADPPVVLAVLETVAAGSVPTRRVGPGTCARIMTGAPMPEGADAVVMVEDTEPAGEGRVRVLAAVAPGRHVRPRGHDVPRGRVVFRPGRTLGPAEVGMLSAMGLPSVMVAQRPRVAVLSTGDEVVEAGWPLGPGQIHSSNTHALMGLVAEAGGVPIHAGIAPDRPAELAAALDRCRRADVVLTTGGVSVGDFDLVKDALSSGDAELAFWKVRMKPGKPLAFGRLGGRPAFGLPGNPVSCMVNFLQFVRPFLRRMLGDPRPFLPVLEAELAGDLAKRPGRALLARVALSFEGGRLVASPVATQSSGALSSMVEADGFALLGAEEGGRRAGERVRVQVFRWGWTAGAAPDYGW